VDMATMGGARVLGRQDEIGSLEVGKLADIAVWRLDTLAHIDIADPVAALVLGGRPSLELLLVNGEPVVEHDQLVRVDPENLASEVGKASKTLLDRAHRVGVSMKET
jgi:cytosine/adenosine deaminase-related metal-dependent hydrolase